MSAEYDDDMQRSELEIYLEEQRSLRIKKLDVLQLWCKNEVHFPVISSMTCDILCIRISTVALESAFSFSGHIIDCFQSTTKFKNVETLLYLRDWFFGEKCNFFMLYCF